jgi:hypothetical protein
MKTFTEWVEANTNEGMFGGLLRSLKGEQLPPNMTPDEKDAYEQLRGTGVSHTSALRTVMGQTVFRRNVSNATANLRGDIEGRWGSR